MTHTNSPPSDATVVEIDPRQPWNATGFSMCEGMRYGITVEVRPDAAGNLYQDDSITCTPEGPSGFKGRVFDWLARAPRSPLNPARWGEHGAIQRLRVLNDRTGRRASFLTVIGCIGRDDSESNCFVIGFGGEFVAHRSGELVVFANDWPGGQGREGEGRFAESVTYANNKGRLLLRVWRL